MCAPVRLALLLVFVRLFSASSVFAVTTTGLNCTNPHTATQQEADSAPGGGIIAGVSQVCPSDANLGVSNSVGSAKDFLNSVPKKCVGGCAAPPDKAHIDKLNNTFAVCAANFIKAYNQKYGAIYISSAYRDGPSGENARAGGANGSNHTRGLAMDMSPANGDFQTIWKFASQNPQFGVCFPYLGSDRPHMALAGTGTGEASKCAAQGVTKACSGAPNFTPSAVTSGPVSPYDEGGALYGNPAAGPSASTPYTALPASPYGSVLQSPGAPAPTFAPTAPMTTIPSYSTPTTPTNPLITTPSTQLGGICSPQFSCSNNVMYYQTTSCTTQVYQNCTNGCNGNSCSSIATTAPSSTLVTTPGGTVHASTTEEILNAFANPVTFTASNSATATPIAVVLNGNTTDIAQITSAPATASTGSGTITSIQPITAQQTFTSSDMSNAGTFSGNSSAPVSSMVKVLADLRAALVWAIHFLNPLSSTK